MWLTILKGFWEKVGGYLLLVAAVLASLVAVRQSGKSAGRQEVETEQVKADIKGVQDAQEARNEIDAMVDDAVRDRARQRMRNRTK